MAEKGWEGSRLHMVGLPHPRHYTIKTSPEFSALKARLTEDIRTEALKVATA